jgi:glycosyltransferase involved in cell wall biosynthesis
MKILYVIHSLQFAGAERLVFDVINKLKHSNQITVISIYRSIDSEGHDKILKFLKENNINYYCLDKKIGFSKIKTIISLQEKIKELKPDIIHAHTYIPNVYCGLRNIIFNKIPTIATIHSGGDDWASFKNWILEKISIKGYSKVITVSEHVKNFYLSKLKIKNRDKVVTIQNGISIDRFPTVSHKELMELRKQLKLNEDDIILINVARLVPIKGQEFLLNVIEKLENHYKLLLVGNLENKDYVNKLRFLTKQKGLENRVYFLGSRDDINKLLQLADLFLFPSLYEASGIALMEAIYKSKRIIASDIPSNNELRAFYPEIKVLDFNVDKWVKAIQKISKEINRNSLWPIQRNEKDFYFSIDRVSKEYYELYKSII